MKDRAEKHRKARSDLAWKMYHAVSCLRFTEMNSGDHERYTSCERFLLAYVDHLLTGGDPEISAEDLKRKMF